jgi:acyl-CoA thioesterase-1
VTLLIGVNNQYRGMDFSLYQKEFPELLDLALRYNGGDKNRVKVLSIPDYWFTPFGQNYHKSTSEEIDQYNAFTRTFAASKSVEFIDITDISRRGLIESQLVAEDGLHLSSLAYEEIVQRLAKAFLRE